MSGSSPFTGSLLTAAQVATYLKGHEVGFAGSKEKTEQARAYRKMLRELEEAAKRQKAGAAQKGTLA